MQGQDVWAGRLSGSDAHPVKEDDETPTYIKRIAMNDVTSEKEETAATVLTLD